MAHTILHDSIPTEGRNLTDAEFLELQKVSDCKCGKYYVTQRDGSTKRGLVWNHDKYKSMQVPYYVEN